MENNVCDYDLNPKKLINQIIVNSNGRLRLGSKSHGSHRLQPANPEAEFSQQQLLDIIKYSNLNLIKIIPPNQPDSASGKFNTFFIEDLNQNIKTSFVLGKGENKGQKFERKTAEAINLATGELPNILKEFIKKINVDISDLEQIIWSGKTNSKRKISLEPKQIGHLIADFKILLKNGKNEYVSLKNKNGDTFGNHGYDSGFKEINENNQIIGFVATSSEYDDFLVNALGINKELIIKGITDILYKNPTGNIENYINIKLNFNHDLLKTYLAGAYGYGYWYVREKSNDDYQIISLNSSEDSKSIIGNIISVVARYPRYSTEKKLCSKQFQATIITDKEKFILELRHSHRGLKPNEIKIKSLGKFDLKKL